MSRNLSLLSLLFPLLALADDPYGTTFLYNENPLSDGRAWRTCASPWPVVKTTTSSGGLALGTQDNQDGDYDDSCAILAPDTVGADQTVSAVVYKGTFDQDCSHDVEILLRATVSGSDTYLYECLFPAASSDTLFQLMQWNGAMGNFEEVCSATLDTPLEDGDQVKCSVSGSTFKVRINGVLKATCSDSTYASGQPGVGLFRRNSDPGCSGSSNDDAGFRSFTAKTVGNVDDE